MCLKIAGGDFWLNIPPELVLAATIHLAKMKNFFVNKTMKLHFSIAPQVYHKIYSAVQGTLKVFFF